MPKKKGTRKDNVQDLNNPLDMVMAQPNQIFDLVATRQKLEASLAAEADLKEVIKQLKEQLGTQKFEQDEIFAYLNKQLVHKSRTVAVLECRNSSCRCSTTSRTSTTAWWKRRQWHEK